MLVSRLVIFVVIVIAYFFLVCVMILVFFVVYCGCVFSSLCGMLVILCLLFVIYWCCESKLFKILEFFIDVVFTSTGLFLVWYFLIKFMMVYYFGMLFKKSDVWLFICKLGLFVGMCVMLRLYVVKNFFDFVDVVFVMSFSFLYSLNRYW